MNLSSVRTYGASGGGARRCLGIIVDDEDSARLPEYECCEGRREGMLFCEPACKGVNPVCTSLVELEVELGGV
jgi:hypothetical protein